MDQKQTNDLMQARLEQLEAMAGIGQSINEFLEKINPNIDLILEADKKKKIRKQIDVDILREMESFYSKVRIITETNIRIAEISKKLCNLEEEENIVNDKEDR